MPYEYRFRVLEDSLNAYSYANLAEAENKFKGLTAAGYTAAIYPIIHNTDPRRAEYEYRMFDIVDLTCMGKTEFGMVLCNPDKDPEYHGLKNSLDKCFDYIDNYYYILNN